MKEIMIYPHFDYVENNNYLFKVTYNKKVINVDFFHLLTDGLGAISFIKSIISFLSK